MVGVEQLEQRLRVSPLAAVAPSVLQDLGFSTTDNLTPLIGVLGQQRAKDSMAFATAIDRPEYNVYVMGESGSGRSSFVRQHLASAAQSKARPADWIYVNNFRNARCPRAVSLPAGTAQVFFDEINNALGEILSSLAVAFEHPTYLQKKNQIDAAFNHRFDSAVQGVEALAADHDLALYRDAGSYGFTPMVDGKALNEAEFAALADERRQAFHASIKAMEQALNDALLGLSQWRRELAHEHLSHIRGTAEVALAPVFSQLRAAYDDAPGVISYLSGMCDHLVQQVTELCVEDQTFDMRLERIDRHLMEEVYLPNVLVSQIEQVGCPVVYEPNPTYRNLMGHIDYVSDQGVLVTSYRQLFAGALHRANGGYLILDAQKLLMDPVAWQVLKRALQGRALALETPAAELGLLGTQSLTPEAVTLDVKVVIIGDREIYYLLQEFDSEFPDMFRVLVDFDESILRSVDTCREFASLVAGYCQQQRYPGLTVAAVDRLIAYSSRLAENQRYLTARFQRIFELLDEACLCAVADSASFIEADHVDQALEARRQRSHRLADVLLDQILEGTLLVASTGIAVGQVNGLTVMDLAETRIGTPARITATAYAGSRGVVDIEREVALGKSVHSKGVLILSGYLGNQFAQDFPLSVSAHIALEQSYGYVDGDSASLGEICCLLSAIARLPLRQELAVTGSINQHGEVQAVGAVNEKVEGFFALCQARGLSGTQGVVLPKANLRHLMLGAEVLAAMAAGQFHLYAVNHVDEALALLAARPAGDRGATGEFPADSLNGLVARQLRQWWQVISSQQT